MLIKFFLCHRSRASIGSLLLYSSYQTIVLSSPLFSLSKDAVTHQDHKQSVKQTIPTSLLLQVMSHCLCFYHSHCKSLVSMRSSSVSNSTTRMTQATRKQLKPADSRQTCHSAALRPQHGFSQFDLMVGREEERERQRDREEGEKVVRGAVGAKINGASCCGVLLKM